MGKGTEVAAMHECVCELLQVTGKKWGLWEWTREGAAVGSRVGALALFVCGGMAAGEENMSSVRPEVFGLYVMSL